MKVPFTEFSSDFSVRADPDFIKGARELNKFISTSKLSFFKLKEALAEKPRNGKNTSQTSYSMTPTRFVYLSVDAIKAGRIDLSDPIYLNEDIGSELEKYSVCDGDIIVTRSGTVGVACLVNEQKFEEILIPSGYLIIIKVNENKVDPEFIVEYFNSPLMKHFFETYACGKNTQNISQESLKKAPIPTLSLDTQREILSELNKFETKIENVQKKIPDTQDVIEKVFYNLFAYIPFKEYVKKINLHFVRHFVEFGTKKYLRVGARYNAFWNAYKGLILTSKKDYQFYSINNLMKVHRTGTFKKGYLDNEYILLDKEDVEPKTGVIVNEEYVDKIGSDKVLFGDCDLLISKIDPFLGHVILNDKTKPYIGTTEFIPYAINRTKVNLYFIQYVFLSKNFLEISKYIMAGKRQPRITPYELSSLLIPLPPKEEQQKAVDLIRTELGDLKAQWEELERLKRMKDSWFMNYLKTAEKPMVKI